jgi:hypothetical protein
MDALGNAYLTSAIRRLLTYKDLGEKTFQQLEDKDFHFQPNIVAGNMPDANRTQGAPPMSNSIAIIIRHMSGNMLSRWTNFLTEDGEKDWRNRDTEFDPPQDGKEQLLELWEKGWDCLLGTLRSLKEEDLLKTIHIRHEPLTAIDAINRQLAHYPYHVGQIVYIGKLIRNDGWVSLSIPPGQSQDFNREMEKRK